MIEPPDLTTFNRRIEEARKAKEAEKKKLEAQKAAQPAPAPRAAIPGLEDIEDTDTDTKARAKAYWEKSVQTAVTKMQTMSEGSRNEELNTQIHNVVANAVFYGFDYTNAVDLIKMAARANTSGTPMTKQEVERTAKSGIDGGRKHPREIPLSVDLPATENIVVTFPELTEPDFEADETEDEIKGGDYPTYNWKDVLPDKNTFLDAYCAEAFKVSLPREFQLWVGLTILGTTVGRRIAIKRIENPTYSNLAVCLTTTSAVGKGRSMKLGQAVLRMAVPFDDTPIMSGLDPEGVRIMQLPGSGEQLVRELAISHIDEKTKRVIRKITCNTLVIFSEMDRFVSKAGAGGGNNAYKSYIQDFTDGEDEINTSTVGSGRATVYNGFASFLTSTQPGHLRSQFSQRDKASGLLNRFIFPFGRGVKQPAFESVDIDRAIPAALLKEISKWTEGLKTNSDPLSAPGYWYRDEAWAPAAAQTYSDFIDRVIDPECERNTANSDILGRMRLNILRLILLFAVNAMSKTIEVEHVNSALALYPYMRDCAMLLSAEVHETERSEFIQMIMDAVEKHESKYNQPPTRNELNRVDTRIKNMNEEDFTKTTEMLIRAKRLHTVLTGRSTGAGRKGLRYSSTPAEEWKKITQTVKLAEPKSDK